MLAARMQNALLGVALGDALGATLEFLAPTEVAKRYGTLTEIVGGGWLKLAPGDITDDTQMTLAVAEGILENPTDPVAAIGRRFIAWLSGNPPDVGGTCRLAIEAAQACGDWDAAARIVHDRLGERAAGNGSLMRTLPVALAYYGDDASVARMAECISWMTHPTVTATHCCQLYCLLVCRLLDGYAKTEAFDWLHQQLQQPEYSATVRHALLAPNVAPKASGYVVDSLQAALWAFQESDSAESCIVKAANLGDDADTVAAIAGGLAGAYYRHLPERWLRCLKDRARIEGVAAQLARLAG